ncbi:glycosyltransferase family 1 protein [Leptospira congkakensis]|uniref:Glycosyltransferase family 1 protein n=1 Tax=Leptospira congkakensis TaxID=2484932 RepID=A0A4Z1A5S0_9LEPT|nr:glycosyltransferase family 1 protein [Leptospira congkakensis]TGL90245.1 glycosyltransferase family 1 protein [Leptospira congkakensis]TGL91252.1 glycosyltransferase family 1 protein [Leptospira congkakensis]TGL98304.1 glycosyltransferase family 1 protein [Leptospira congkakensis]
MKLIFDVSVLAWSVRSNKAKTGIFRVIENLLFQLLRDKEIELYLSSIHGNILDLKTYLKNSNIQISDDRLLVSKSANRFKDKLFQIYFWLYQQLDLKNYPRVSAVLLFLYSFSRFFLSLIGLYGYFYPIPKRFLTDSFVFHSTFLPIPKYIQTSKINKVVTIYDLISIKYPEFFVGNKDDVVWKLIRDINPETKIITISDYSKKDLLSAELGLLDHQITVTPLAASKFFYQVESKDQLSKDLNQFHLSFGEYILSVATLEPRKNLKSTIRAFLQLPSLKSNSNLKLVLLGGKGWGENFEDIAGEFPALFQERILFLGFVPDEQLSSIYSGAKFFVYLSFYEGFGLPPLEAMQCGLPVLVSNVSSLPEVVGEAGLYANPYDLNSIIAGMENLLNDNDLRSSFSRRALERAKLFTWERTAKLTKETYFNFSANENII